MCQIFVQAVFAQMLSVVAWQRSVALTVDATLTQRWLSQMQQQSVGILVHAPTLMLMMTNAAWARECVRKPTAMTATRSWQTLQIIVMMPHVQMVNVVVRQQHAQIMVAARWAR
jgi:O-acetylhomoserine/O-acetylserine sulfhydrylase-like pyridoxal-dependent enzyme